jgi:hypothetical protein
MKFVYRVSDLPYYVPLKASINNNARVYYICNEVDERILALFAENNE